MVAPKEQLIGNFCFYEYLLSKRNPTFLNRNWVRALEIHRQELQAQSDQSPTAPAPNRTHWRYLSNKEIVEMTRHQEESRAFVVDICGIEPLNHDDIPRGHPARKVLSFRLEADVQITIVDSSRGVEIKKLAPAKVTLLGIQSENSKKVSLDLPTTTVKLDDLLRAAGSSRRKTTPRDWTLKISIYLQDDSDARELYRYMLPSETTRSSLDPPTCLRARWHNIRECPEGDKVIPFSTSTRTNNTSSQLGFGLAVRMSWTSPRGESILASHNQKLDESQSEPYRYSPTRSRPLTVSRQEYVLGFDYPEGITVYPDARNDHPSGRFTQRSLKCPENICNTKNSFTELYDLHMHLETHHDYFKHTLKKQHVIDGIEYWKFKVELAEHRPLQSRASNTAPDPLDIQIIAPQKPFDQQKYLYEGNDDFQKAARLEKGGKPGTRVNAVVTRATRAIIPLRQPDEVQERTQPERRTYRVPKAPPDVTFFRSISKRPLREGEYISESDDEVDETWCQQKKAAQMATDQSMSEASKRFLGVFDSYMREEWLQGDAHIGDALVRFARASATRLWEGETVDEFKAKITEMFEDDLVSKEIHAACLHIVDEQNPTERPRAPRTKVPLSAALDKINASSRPRRVDKGKGKARTTPTGQITPQTTDSDVDIEMRDATEPTNPTASITHINLCLCGEDAFSSRRPIVVCENVICDRQAFHIDCVMRFWKPAQPPDPKDLEWTCNNCAHA